MITNVTFENYRCLKQVSVSLRPFTVLVGPNASGKSAFLAGLNPSLVPGLGDCWRQDRDQIIQRTIRFDDRRWTRQSISQRENRTEGDGEPYSWQRLRLDLKALRNPNQVQHEAKLGEDGGNLPNVFATLPRKTQNDVAAQLCELVPVFGDVDVRPRQQGDHWLVFEDRWNPGLWYNAYEVSDGALLTLAFLLLQHQSAPVDLVAIEEPERGIHPYLLGELVSLLRGLSDGTRGKRKIQIVAASHSAELLDHLRPEEVRFMRRIASDGSVEVAEAPLGTPEWKRVYDEYQESMGGIWLSGGMGGVPGA